MDMSIKTIYGEYSSELFLKLKRISLLVFDVDGTLTDSGIFYDDAGSEIKRFSVRDGMGIAMLNKYSNVKTAIITARKSPIVERRAHELNINFITQASTSKAQSLKEICTKNNIETSCIAVFGDDINDLEMMALASFKACPNDAHPGIKTKVDFITENKAGFGAARELCDLILMAKGILSIEDGTTILKNLKDK